MIIVEILANFFGIFTGLISLIGELFTVCIIGKRNRQLINLLYRVAGKENERKNIIDFHNYVNHKLNTISQESLQASEYSVKLLKKDLKPNTSHNQMIFILGDPGSGKSTLMLHLAFWYCKYNNPDRTISSVENLKRWRIFYCRMRDYHSLKELKDKLDDTVEALFLDGFDEFVVLQDKSEEDVLEELLGILFEDRSNTFRKIYISSRKEPFKDHLMKILEGRNLNGHHPQIIEICPFDRKQILALYKKNCKKGKRRSLYKMKRYLSKNETIFRIPLLIEYADIILKEYSDSVSPSLWQALNAIVNDWMKREEQLWHSRQGIGKKWDKEKQSAYYQNAWAFILAMCQNMVQTGSYSFRAKEIENNFSDLNNKYFGSHNQKFFFSTRQLIHKTNAEEYEFIHMLFFEFFAARLLISLKSTTFERKMSLLSDPARNYKKFYAYWLQYLSADVFDINMSEKPLLHSLEGSIENYVVNGERKNGMDSVGQIRTLISADSVDVKDEPEITVYGILWLFPLVKEIKWKSYDLSTMEITNLMGESASLSLTNGRLKDISDLSSFFPFQNLDIRNNNITNLEQMTGYGSFERLCLYGNRLESLKPLANIEISKLEISIWNEKDLTDLLSLAVDNCSIDLPQITPLYIKFEHFQKDRKHWHLAFVPDIKDFLKHYEKVPYAGLTDQILKAVFHLIVTSFCTEDHFEPAAFDFAREAGKSLYIKKEYKESMEIFRQLMSVAENSVDTEEKIRFKTEGWIGQIYAKTGEYERAVLLLKKACGEQWADDLDSEIQIMWYWLMASLYQINYEINLTAYGIYDIFRAMYLWGEALERDKQYEEAEGVLDDLYQKQSRNLGETHKDVLSTQFHLGRILSYRNKYEEAEKMFSDCLEKQKDVLGELHEGTLSTRVWYGFALYKEKKYEESEDVLRNCFELRKEVLGELHEDTLNAQRWLGDTLHQNEKYEEAERELEDCWKKRKKILGEMHKDTLSTQLWYGSTLYKEEKYGEAEDVLRNCFEGQKEVLGELHEDTLIAQKWLGYTLYQNKKYEEAERELEDCWEKQKKILGEKHKNTLRVQKWYGSTLYEEEKYDMAEKVLYDCYEKCKEVLGEAHTDTLRIKRKYESAKQNKT